MGMLLQPWPPYPSILAPPSRSRGSRQILAATNKIHIFPKACSCIAKSSQQLFDILIYGYRAAPSFLLQFILPGINTSCTLIRKYYPSTIHLGLSEAISDYEPYLHSLLGTSVVRQDAKDSPAPQAGRLMPPAAASPGYPPR